MEEIKRHKVYAVWLLLAIFTLPFAEKTIHLYHVAGHTEHECPDKPHSHHDCNNCPVCHFALSNFTEAQDVSFDFRVVPSFFELIIAVQSNVCQQVLISYGLRAPPMA